MLQLSKAYATLTYHDLRNRMNRKSKEAADAKQAQALSDLQTKGFHEIEGYYSPEECAELRGAIDGLIDQYDAYVWTDDLKADKRIFGAEEFSEQIKRFHSDPWLMQVGELYHQADLLNSQTLAARIEGLAENKGSGGGWHRDSVFVKQIKALVYLSDVEDTNGPFQFIEGTHQVETIYSTIRDLKCQAGQMRFTPEEIDRFTQKFPQYKQHQFTRKQGSLILVDTRGLHRGMPVKTGMRYSMFNYYYPVHHYNENQQAKFQKLLLKNRIPAS